MISSALGNTDNSLHDKADFPVEREGLYSRLWILVEQLQRPRLLRYLVPRHKPKMRSGRLHGRMETRKMAMLLELLVPVVQSRKRKNKRFRKGVPYNISSFFPLRYSTGAANDNRSNVPG